MISNLVKIKNINELGKLIQRQSYGTKFEVLEYLTNGDDKDMKQLIDRYKRNGQFTLILIG